MTTLSGRRSLAVARGRSKTTPTVDRDLVEEIVAETGLVGAGIVRRVLGAGAWTSGWEREACVEEEIEMVVGFVVLLISSGLSLTTKTT